MEQIFFNIKFYLKIDVIKETGNMILLFTRILTGRVVDFTNIIFTAWSHGKELNFNKKIINIFVLLWCMNVKINLSCNFFGFS